MKKFNRIFYLFFTCIILHGCSAVPPELKTAEQLMETAPDSALHTLRKLNGNTIRGGYNHALYALLMSRALDKNEINIENDSLISIATDYFDNSDPVHAGYAWFYHARTARNRGNLEEQANNLFKAMEYAEKSKNNLLLGSVIYDIAIMNFYQRQYNYSISYFKSAANYFKQIKDKKSIVLSNLYIGYCYLYTSKIDSAQVYYRQAEKVASSINNKILLSIIFRNIGTVYFQQANYYEALKYFYKVPLTNNKVYDSNKYYLIADVYIKTNRLDSARYYLNKVDNLHEIAPDYYRLWQAIAEKENDKTKALFFANKVSIVTDSIYKKKLETSLVGLEKKYKYQGLQIVNQALTLKNKQKGLLILLTLLVLSILSVIMLFWKLRVKKNEIIVQKQLLANETAILKSEKENSALLEKQLHLQSILLSNLNMYRKNTVKRPGLWKDGSNDILADQLKTFYDELITHVNMEYNNFTFRLKEKFPNLTERDIKFCCLLLANFETGMIATIFNINNHSIIIHRSRLRNKLNLPTADNLIEFLRQF